jgi:hypothetical protein
MGEGKMTRIGAFDFRRGFFCLVLVGSVAAALTLAQSAQNLPPGAIECRIF